jgi:hypothetical protein
MDLQQESSQQHTYPRFTVGLSKREYDRRSKKCIRDTNKNWEPNKGERAAVLFTNFLFYFDAALTPRLSQSTNCKPPLELHRYASRSGRVACTIARFEIEAQQA